jgi:hypothetical protein
MITCARVEGDAPRVTRNTFAECYWAGGIDRYTSAIVSRNAVVGNTDGYIVSGEGARVERNVFEGNAFEGLFVADPDAVVDRNVATGNSYEPSERALGGIVVRSAGTVVSRNTANANADYGIYAVPGVVDGGGNRARDNGNRFQCLNVACRR